MLTWISCIGADIWLWQLSLPISVVVMGSVLLLHCAWQTYRTHWQCTTPFAVTMVCFTPCNASNWQITLANGQCYMAMFTLPYYVNTRLIILRLTCYPCDLPPLAANKRCVTVLLTPGRVGRAYWRQMIVNCYYQSSNMLSNLM